MPLGINALQANRQTDTHTDTGAKAISKKPGALATGWHSPGLITHAFKIIYPM